ncbi:hypothetical protein HER10_EVM0009482 [Colletotrichum scovillei]|uniref:SSCRP protein n=1 Tax=Colletotrichum scovillei TaxID=1209932 RepID=A0A9P7RIP0_9PEZI|nr:uncharacterized protein HER10_EVM0009482 [Colletotrichum scovillei]KAF4777895.1 hypothetical protein HER10_EVM0009482 [Colletotrichum scovillei]KAG7059076.1 SSCRP protein [Colletotrichum scovillei]KAG7077644.1 SSCRP protein [Colletotrichum scovillei]KAG7084730.1 SSCRP protein [Colletotrichum scovillei]
MRSSQSAPALVALLFVATASALSPARLHCLRSRNLELARLAACGEPGSVAHCMEMVADDFTQTDLERCYINAGCDFAEAVIESQWTLDRCDNSGSAPAELRKRHVTVFARQTTEATAATAETATGTSTGTATYSKLTCSTSTTKSTTQCPVVSTGVQKGKTLKEGCFPTQVVYGTCAAGLLCKNDNSGNPSCKVLDNTVYPGGIAVALFFAVAITGSIAWITFLCCKERKQKKRNAARVQAAMDAKMAAKRQPAVQVHDSDNQPLMSYGQPAAAYEAHGPFGDQNRM